MSETDKPEIEVTETMADDDKNKFRLLDILVTLIILASVTAVISPRFSVASSEARITEMVSSLQKVRSQVQIYTIQHNGLLPGQRIHGENVKQADFINDLCQNNPETGRSYLEEMPENPFNKLNTITCVNMEDLLPDGTEGTGWWFNAANGRFHACDGAFHAQY